METLTTNMAAERLSVSRRRVIALIENGRLPAEKFGRDYVIKESDLALVAERKAGRPKKEGSATAAKSSKSLKTARRTARPKNAAEAGTIPAFDLTESPSQTKAVAMPNLRNRRAVRR